MKSKLRLTAHSILEGAAVVEIWHNDQMIGTIYGADGPGVRVVSKHEITVSAVCDSLSVAEVKIREVR